MKIVLFAPVEANLKDINSTKDKFNRYFEKEAIKSFSCWRENGGWLKDIPIYAVCSTKATLSEETRKKFRELNVTYIESYQPVTETYECGFWNIPLVGKWIEENIQADVFIKIDLDMYLIRPLPEYLFYNLKKSVVGLHDHLAEMHLASISEKYPTFKHFFNTGFTISTPQSKFFTLQMKYLIMIEEEFKKLGVEGFRQKYGPNIVENTTREDPTSIEHRLMEEMCVSIMYNDGIPIEPIRNYYLETNEYELDKSVQFNLNKIYFIHEHIDDNLSQTNLINQIKYKKKLNLKGYEYFMSWREK
jgi:hypothetical protein